MRSGGGDPVHRVRGRRGPQVPVPIVPVLILCALASAVHGQTPERARVNLQCEATGRDLVYDCAIRLRGARSGAAIDGVEITVSVDMPSMPMAHNVKPVKATRTDTPGIYAFRLDLAMVGVWAVKLRLAGAVRDQLVETLEFNAHGVTKPSPGR